MDQNANSISNKRNVITLIISIVFIVASISTMVIINILYPAAGDESDPTFGRTMGVGLIGSLITMVSVVIMMITLIKMRSKKLLTKQYNPKIVKIEERILKEIARSIIPGILLFFFFGPLGLLLIPGWILIEELIFSYKSEL